MRNKIACGGRVSTLTAVVGESQPAFRPSHPNHACVVDDATRVMQTSIADIDYVGAIGPGSDLLNHNLLDNLAPVSRNGEVTQNAFIDGPLYNITRDSHTQLINAGTGIEGEEPAQFYEWASTVPGLICVFLKNKQQQYMRQMGAESAVPVVACAQNMSMRHNKFFQFAGICRSKNVRSKDDVDNGITKDEYFTLAIGGQFTILNTGNGNIENGDLVEWTFQDTRLRMGAGRTTIVKGKRAGPRRVQVRKWIAGDKSRIFGTAQGFAKKGERFDVLIGPGSM